MQRPVFGRASPASAAPWKLRASADASTAAVRADGGDLGPFSVRVACVAGVRHRVGGVGPEDSYAWWVGDGCLVVAVADGVGSTPGSAAAAAAAAMAAVAAPERAVEEADAAVRLAGGATTLVVASVDAEGTATLVRVGDSSAFVLGDGGWEEVWPKVVDEQITTATAALPASAPTPGTATVRLGPGEALVLVTDGVADPLRDGPTTVAPGLAEALRRPPEPLELARLVDFSRQGVGDDRTLLAVWVQPDTDDGRGRRAPTADL